MHLTVLPGSCRGLTALSEASLFGHVGCIRLLLEGHANPNAVADKSRFTT